MPTCFALTRNSAPEKGPIPVGIIDRELCRLLGKPISPTYYVCDWVDTIAMSLALGHSFPEVKQEIMDGRWGAPELLIQICEYLEANYTAQSWVEVDQPTMKR